MKTQAGENEQRHAAVRPDVFAGKAWLWRGVDERREGCVIRICVDPEEGTYVTLFGDGNVHVWSRPKREEAGNLGWTNWEEAPQ